MSIDDDFKPLPTRTGVATGHANERTMFDTVGKTGFRTMLRENPDGSTTMLRTKGGMPEFTTTAVRQKENAAIVATPPPPMTYYAEGMLSPGQRFPPLVPIQVVAYKLVVDFSKRSVTRTVIDGDEYLGKDATDNWKKYHRNNRWRHKDGIRFAYSVSQSRFTQHSYTAFGLGLVDKAMTLCYGEKDLYTKLPAIGFSSDKFTEFDTTSAFYEMTYNGVTHDVVTSGVDHVFDVNALDYIDVAPWPTSIDEREGRFPGADMELQATTRVGKKHMVRSRDGKRIAVIGVAMNQWLLDIPYMVHPLGIYLIDSETSTLLRVMGLSTQTEGAFSSGSHSSDSSDFPTRMSDYLSGNPASGPLEEHITQSFIQDASGSAVLSSTAILSGFFDSSDNFLPVWLNYSESAITGGTITQNSHYTRAWVINHKTPPAYDVWESYTTTLDGKTAGGSITEEHSASVHFYCGNSVFHMESTSSAVIASGDVANGSVNAYSGGGISFNHHGVPEEGVFALEIFRFEHPTTVKMKVVVCDLLRSGKYVIEFADVENAPALYFRGMISYNENGHWVREITDDAYKYSNPYGPVSDPLSQFVGLAETSEENGIRYPNGYPPPYNVMRSISNTEIPVIGSIFADDKIIMLSIRNPADLTVRNVAIDRINKKQMEFDGSIGFNVIYEGLSEVPPA